MLVSHERLEKYRPRRRFRYSPGRRGPDCRATPFAGSVLPATGAGTALRSRARHRISQRGWGMTIREAAAALRARRVSSAELTTNALARAARLNSSLRAFITVMEE